MRSNNGREPTFPGFSSPNGTIVPDEVFDVLMPILSDAQFRVLMYIIRRTFGFKKNSDDISLKQMVEGIRTKDGRVLDGGTGLSKSAVAKGAKDLVGMGVIEAIRNRSAERGNEPTTYRLHFRDLTKLEPSASGNDENPDVPSRDGSDPLVLQKDKGGCPPGGQALVHQEDTQQTGKTNNRFRPFEFRKVSRPRKDDGRSTNGGGEHPTRTCCSSGTRVRTTAATAADVAGRDPPAAPTGGRLDRR